MITEVLDTTTNSRVTMKMDVSYIDHTHIIGKGGNTIRRVIAETNGHFPIATGAILARRITRYRLQYYYFLSS